MQFITFLSVAAATWATASAEDFFQRPGAPVLNKQCDSNKPMARVINRCDYPVYLWSVLKSVGCPVDQMVTLKPGEIYSENLINATAPLKERLPVLTAGVSIKVSKSDQCKGGDITQLEYFLNDAADDPDFRLNYLDVSYVDCLGGDCPSKKEGYYMEVGTAKVREQRKTTDNSWCPILSCHDAVSCALMSYILPDDVRTKTCDLTSNMDLYLCGSQPPSEDDNKPAASSPAPDASSSAPAPSSQKPESPSPKPSTTSEAASSSAADDFAVKAAAVTPAAEVKEAPKAPNVKTEIVYVTAYEYVNAKRSEHVHKHARRHQPFHA